MPLLSPVPPISTSQSHLLTFLFASTYVGSLYISKNARLSFSSKAGPPTNNFPREKSQNERWRDDPDVIRARLVAVTSATVLCCAGIFSLSWYLTGDSTKTVFAMTVTRLGFSAGLDMDSLYPHLVTPVLFFGPLYAMHLGSRLPFQRRWTFQVDFMSRILSWQGLRNYVLAPITEEIVFRACVLSVYRLSGASNTRMIFLGPLSFGLAHVHHAWDTFNRYGRTASAAKRASLMSLFQLIYTMIFGFHCSYLFLRTGSILPPISAHIFCNIMGLPEISWELKQFPKHRIELILAYILGIIGFGLTIVPWTHIEQSSYPVRH